MKCNKWENDVSCILHVLNKFGMASLHDRELLCVLGVVAIFAVFSVLWFH